MIRIDLRVFVGYAFGMNRWIVCLHLPQDEKEVEYYRLAFEENRYRFVEVSRDHVLICDAVLVFLRDGLMDVYGDVIGLCVERDIPMIVVNPDGMEFDEGIVYPVDEVSFEELDDLLHEKVVEKEKDKRFVVFLFAALLFFMAFAGYVGFRLSPRDEVVDVVEVSEEEKVMNKYGGGVVQVWSIGSFGASMYRGSGFVVDNAGYVVTNAHVVDHPSSMYRLVVEGKVVNAEVVAESGELDIALLKADVALNGALRFVKDEPDGDSLVYAIGYPEDAGKTIVSGVYNGTRIVGSEGILYAIAFVRLKPGNSGSPVINEKGEVVGIASAMSVLDEEIGMVVGYDVCREYLKEYVFLP